MKQSDYGADPIGNGLHRMVPSGDIVTTEERVKRLSNPLDTDRHQPLIGAYNALQVEAMQGGKLKQ